MKTTIIKISLLTVFLVFFSGMINAQTPDQLFQKGIMKEEGEGSLKEAIELYKAVADNIKADKVLRAKALYQMGNCYEKLGQQEARNVYEKLVANYTDPQELVANAKRKLNKLSGDSAMENSGIVARQVWSPAVSGAFPGSPSPDGKYLLYIDYKTVQITIRDLKTGKSQDVTNDGTWTGKTEYSEGCIWSPDSKQIVYTWAINENEKGERDYLNELRIINIDGTNKRIIKSTGYYYPLDWSKDGNSILCINYSKHDSDNLEIVSVKDGSTKNILKIGNLRLEDASFSEDGKYVVYSREKESKTRIYDIYSLEINSGKIQPLITNKENDESPLYIPGTNQVVFFSNHSGSKDLWLMTVADGKIVGEPKIIKSGFPEESGLTGFTNNGELFYSTATTNPDIYYTRLDITSGTANPLPVKRLIDYQGKAVKSIWSPSMTFLATTVEAPFWNERKLSRLVKVVILNTKTGKENVFETGVYSRGWWPHNEITWLPEEQSVLIKGFQKDTIDGIFQLDVKTGTYKNFDPGHIAERQKSPYGIQFSPDKKTMYYASLADTAGVKMDPVNIIARVRETGEERILKTIFGIHTMLISPDGKYIVYNHSLSDNGSLYVLHAEGNNETRKIFDNQGKDELVPVGWTNDSQNVLFAKVNGAGQVSVWSVSISNESPKELFSKEALKAFTGSDGFRIINKDNDYYLTSEKNNPVYEVWSLENIVPKELSEKK